TGQLEREIIPLGKKLKLLFLFNHITEWIDTTHAMRLYMHNKSLEKGKKEASPASKQQISKFVDYYGINMDDFDPSDINEYNTFEDFFARAHKAGSRPIHRPDDALTAVVVADSRVVTYESVAETKKIWIKGHDFSITNLVMDTQLGSKYEKAAVASFRLSPQDYHRYHSPVTGKIKLFRSIPGDYYQVDPVALQSQVDILTRNRRAYVIIETAEFGDVLFVAIGATNVGSVVIHEQFQKSGVQVNKGDELGHFQFGGSSIIVAFQVERIKFDNDLLQLSKQRIQVSVEVGDTVDETTAAASESIKEMVRWGATNGVSIHPKKTDVMHFSRSKLRTAPPAIVPNPCREVGGKSEGSGLLPTSTHQYETRSATECCPKRRQGVSRASPALRLRSVVPRHDKAAMEPAYQRPAIEQPASHTEKEQGLEPVHETYTAPLEDDTHRRPPPGKWDTASYSGPRSTATQVLRTTQVA
ncbi:phosphatidylserine decarboxylase, partial [Fusarium mundagurra]